MAEGGGDAPAAAAADTANQAEAEGQASAAPQGVTTVEAAGSAAVKEGKVGGTNDGGDGGEDRMVSTIPMAASVDIVGEAMGAASLQGATLPRGDAEAEADAAVAATEAAAADTVTAIVVTHAAAVLAALCLLVLDTSDARHSAARAASTAAAAAVNTPALVVRSSEQRRPPWARARLWLVCAWLPMTRWAEAGAAAATTGVGAIIPTAGTKAKAE